MPRPLQALRLLSGVLFAGLVSSPVTADSATLYVDRQIGSASCSNYNPAARACGGGAESAYRTLGSAAGAAVAGDTVQVRGGTYNEALVPSRSGTAAQPITYVVYPGEIVTLSGTSSTVLRVTQRSYVVIDGFTVSDVGGWGRLEDSSNITIRNNRFEDATIEGTTGGLKLVRSNSNKILNNTFEDGNDNIVIQESDLNVIQGNTISYGRHSLLSLRCGNYNVIRDNTFSNPDQKDLEIYDCEGTSDAPYKLDATKRNLVEGNVIADTRSASADHKYNGIQYGGQQGIVRRNVFRDNMGGGINFQYYSDESLYNNRNRVYHNTFYNNRCYGIVGDEGAASRFYDNRARNNILYANSDCSGGGGQVRIKNPSQVILADNALATSDPGFVDAPGRNFHLNPGSPMIDAAAFLTKTAAGGSGTQVPVLDASYFFDGYGIAGELGDEIRLQGQSSVARVVAVDLSSNRLTLDRTLTWTAGQGVSLVFSGSGPDLGAFEASSAELPELSTSDVTVTEGHSGTVSAIFTVSVSPASSSTVTASYSTANGTAAAGSDYAAASGQVSFAPEIATRTVSVSVAGDVVPESDEDFYLNLSNPTNATIADGQGRAMILDDDGVAVEISIADASGTEGEAGASELAFAVTLSAASAQTIGVSYATVDDTATGGSDYVANTGNLSFPPGATSRTVSVSINGDIQAEPDERFFVDLSGPSGAILADARGEGTIVDDDAAGGDPPFGSFDSPADGASGLAGAFAVTGWALDDVAVSAVQVFRDPVAGEPTQPNGKVYVGDAGFVPGARPDVAALYPEYPNSDRAGWGIMLLSNFLPAGGNGSFTLFAYATDSSGGTTLLGSKAIECDNAAASKPFGTLDTPAQGATVSGNGFLVWGWALTPPPAAIPTDGSTIQVYVDGLLAGQPVYSLYREDIATAFPGYANSDAGVGYHVLDTTQLSNGMHSIAWLVTDDQGRTEGIGSRYFWVQN